MITNKDVKLTWNQLRELFMAYNNIRTDTGNTPGKKEPLHAVVVFKSSNWPDGVYDLESRSYHCTSNNKCFYDYCSGYSCFAESLAGDDPYVDITKYDWEIDYCYLL
jgi:hypothetical protein